MGNPCAVGPPIIRPAITFPDLRAFSLDVWGDEFCSIRTPALESLAVFHHDKSYQWQHLEGMKLSMVKIICIRLRGETSRGYHNNGNAWTVNNSPNNMGCISTPQFEDSCRTFSTFHNQIPVSYAASDQDSLLPPKNSFHLDLPWSVDFDELFHQLNRATNLVELAVDFQSLEAHPDQISFLTKLLNNFETIRHLTVLNSPSFALICDLLGHGKSAPSLERLNYHSSVRVSSLKFLPKGVGKMQKARIDAFCQPLKIIELKNFKFMSLKQVERIEATGIQLIQVRSLVSKRPSLMCLGGLKDIF